MNLDLENIKLLREAEASFGRLLTKLRRRIAIPDEVTADYRRQVGYALEDYVEDYAPEMERRIADGAGLAVKHWVGKSIPYVAASMIPVAAYEMATSQIPGRIAAEAMGRTLPSGYTLSGRIWNLRYEDDIIAIVRNGIANNLSPELLSRQLDGFILPNRHVVTNTPYGRALNFDSMRLARSEIMSAGRRADYAMLDRTPWVDGVVWTLSTGHSILCECDDLDGNVYASEADAPMEPHPQCNCHLEPAIINDAKWQRALTEYTNSGGAVDPLGISQWAEGVESFAA